MTEIFTSAKVERGGNLDGVLRQVGFQGELGAYSEIALLRLEPLVKLQPIRMLAEVFAAVESGLLDAGVVPVKNSLAGSIGETYDLLLSTR